MHEREHGEEVERVGLADRPLGVGARCVRWRVPEGAEGSSQEVGEPFVLALVGFGRVGVDPDDGLP
jgi:hypothetical protein